MHILQINTEKGWRGGERQTLLSMEGLRDAGVPVTLLCLKNRPLWQRARETGFPVIGAAHHLAVLWHLLVHGNRYSILHTQSSRAFGFAAIATLFIRTPVVYTRRVDFVPRGTLTRWKYRRAAALVAVSGAIRDILQRTGMGNATVISDIVSEKVLDPLRCSALLRELGIDDRRIVGVVAALVGHKDPLTMVRAAAAVCDRLPDALFLHFGDGPLREAVEAEIRRLGLHHSYRLLGYRDAVEDYFPLFDCFAMSSNEEGLGSSVLDAFRTGVPVASTCAGGLAELVDKRGLVSAVGDPAALAENIIRLMSDRSLAEQYTAAARSYVAQRHNRALLTGRYIDLYRRITRPPPAGRIVD
jgi:glycosyltransferase involved in cell wall biosynthesis